MPSRRWDLQYNELPVESMVRIAKACLGIRCLHSIGLSHQSYMMGDGEGRTWVNDSQDGDSDGCSKVEEAFQPVIDEREAFYDECQREAEAEQGEEIFGTRQRTGKTAYARYKEKTGFAYSKFEPVVRR